MARINNLTKYPYDYNITENDFVIGTDGDNKKTKNFPVVALAEYVRSSNNLSYNRIISIGEVTYENNNITINVADLGNVVYINEKFYTKNTPDVFTFTPVTEGVKIILLYALPDEQVFYMIEGVESNEAVEPDLPSGALFVQRIIVTVNGVEIIPNAVIISDNKVQITEETPFANIGQSQKEFNKNISDKLISLTDSTEVTKPELDILISENKLEPNRLYKITGVESWCFSQHLIKAIYLKAITNNTLESEGVGEFYTPKYNTSDSNLGIWKGELFANGMIDSLSYNIGDKVIWGNLFWENISGNIGSNLRAFDGFDDGYFMQNWISETDWQLITPNDDKSLYNIQFDAIKYDLENDYINYREDNLGNVYELPYNVLLELNIVNIDPTFIYYLNGIALFQWSNDYFQNNKISDSLVINCNYKHVFKGNFIIEKSIINDNNFFNVDFIGNIFKKSQAIANYLKTYGGILYNNLDNSSINFNKYYFEISYNNLKYNSRIYNNNDNNIIVGTKFSRIKGNNLDNFGNLSNNIFVEEGKSIFTTIKGIYDNNIQGFSTISGNTIKNGSRIYENNLSNYDEINGNTLDTDANIYINFLKSYCKINGHILTGHGRIYGNTLYRKAEITNCKLRISPASSYASGIHTNEIWGGIIDNIDFGNIINPVGTSFDAPVLANVLSDCIIKNKSIIKDLILPDAGGVGLQFIKMNGASEFKNITVNDSIRSVEFINTVFNETSDYSKIIQGADYGGRGFTKYYLDNVLLQDRFDEKQNRLQDISGNVGVGKTDVTATEKLDVNGYVKATGFKTPTGTATQSLTANGGTFDLNTKADLVNGKVPSSQLPSYVDDVLEFANLASFPATGESGKIYIAIDTNITYRWTGTGYAEISASLALGETSLTAYRGDRGKIAYDHSQVTHDKNLVGLGNVDNTSDLNKPISNATQNALNTKANIDDIPSKTTFTYDILVANWTLVSGKYEAVISNAGVSANSFVDVIPSNDNVDIVRSAQIYPSVLISEGSVKVYSKFLPSGTISVTVNII